MDKSLLKRIRKEGLVRKQQRLLEQAGRYQ
jgi:hypothetical protein